MNTNALAQRLYLGALLFCAAGSLHAETPTKPAPPAPPTAKTQPAPAAEPDAAPVLLPATMQPVRAQLKARQSTLIASNMTGRISTLDVRDGDRFQKGQVLVGFDCAEEKSRLARAEATKAKKEKQYEINQQLNRLKSVSILEVEISEAEVKEATAETQVMHAVTSKCMITAPFAGRVAERIARPNQTVKEGDPLLEILDDSEMEIEFVAPSRWLTWLKSGYPFAIAIDETGRNYSAEVVRKAGAVDPVSQSIKVYGRITQKAAELMAGMSGTVQIDPPKAPAAPQSPVSSASPNP